MQKAKCIFCMLETTKYCIQAVCVDIANTAIVVIIVIGCIEQVSLKESKKSMWASNVWSIHLQFHFNMVSKHL